MYCEGHWTESQGTGFESPYPPALCNHLFNLKSRPHFPPRKHGGGGVSGLHSWLSNSVIKGSSERPQRDCLERALGTALKPSLSFSLNEWALKP